MCLPTIRIRPTCQLLMCILLVFFCIVHANIQSIHQTKHRVKRKVVFTSSSKFFFRLNGKLNTLNYTTFFATGYSLRINYDLPSTIPKRYKFFKRDIHRDITSIPDESAVRQFSCVVAHFCNVMSSILMSKNCGFFCGIINIIS
ncbi:hypothetical protein NQ318_011864, partial [Aromia moschata]